MCTKNCQPARLDPNGTEKPKTRLVAKVREGVCFGPGSSPEAWELRDVPTEEPLPETRR